MLPPPQILLTGFEPFDGETINPSALIAEALAGRRIAGAEVISRVLPCSFSRAAELLVAAIQSTTPVAVIGLGLAGGREGIQVERIAINIDDARIPDNDGVQPLDTAIIPGGPAAYWSTLPLKAIVAELRQNDISASVSQTAGTFVCNHTFYSLMHLLGTRNYPRIQRAGFVHVPWLPGQPKALAGQPSLPLATQIAAVERIIAVTLMKREIAAVGGADH